MGKYKDIIVKNLKTRVLAEGVLPYGDIRERMHPALEEAIRDGKHSLGNHPAFPDGDEYGFTNKIVAKRFTEVLNNYKKQFDVDSVDQTHFMDTEGMISEIIEMEKPHKKELEKLAIEMVKKEFDIDDDDVELIAELTTDITVEDMTKNDSPLMMEMEFEDHESMVKANDEVYKRRLIDAMKHGAAKKGKHMYQAADEELMAMNPQLGRKYGKLMSLADLAYFMIDDMAEMKPAGAVNVQLPESEDVKPIIHAQGTTFPVMVHEMVKGVMELLSTHGLPEDENIREYVKGKADFKGAERWDDRLGPEIWNRFTECFEAEDFGLKHHVFAEMCSLPVEDFNRTMKEVLAGTKAGKKRIAEMCDEIKNEMALDEYEELMGSDEIGDDTFDVNDLEMMDPSDL